MGISSTTKLFIIMIAVKVVVSQDDNDMYAQPAFRGRYQMYRDLSKASKDVKRSRGAYVSDTEFCRYCIMERNGAGYYEDPSNCQRFLQCDIEKDGSVFAHILECADGSLFDREVVACVPCEQAECRGSIIPSPRCQESDDYETPETTVAPSVLPSSLSGQCLGPHGWIYHADNDDVYSFYRETTIGNKTHIDKVSCGVWRFNLQQCKCVTPVKSAIALYSFDETLDTEVDNFWSDATGVELRPVGKFGGAAYFNGSVHMEIPRFNNYPWGAFSTISYWFKVEGGARKQGLLNNGNCKEVPTIQMYSEGSSLRGQILVTNNETLVTITLREKLITGGAWNHVALVYDGLKIRVFINNQLQKEEVAVGTIPATVAPLFIGRDLNCEGKDFSEISNLEGYIDEIQIYDRALTSAEVEILYLGGRNLEI